MEIKKLDAENNHEISFVENLYIESFPLSERRPVSAMLDLHKEKDSPFVIAVTVEDSQLVGFLTYWDLDEFIFAEHFAISPEFRNGGFGRKAMELLKTDVVKPIVLEVELPTTILSERRIGFYQRLGFRLWENIQYHQPAYCDETGTVPMKLMSFGNIDIEKNLVKIKEKIYNIVYDC